MRKYEIDFEGNALAMIQVDDKGNIEVVGAINGWGNNILSGTIIKEIKKSK